MSRKGMKLKIEFEIDGGPFMGNSNRDEVVHTLRELATAVSFLHRDTTKIGDSWTIWDKDKVIIGVAKVMRR